MDQSYGDKWRTRLNPALLNQVRSIASDFFGIPASQIHPASSPQSIEAWDSVQHLNLVLALEEKFNIQLSPEEIEEMKDIESIAKLVEAKVQPQAS